MNLAILGESHSVGKTWLGQGVPRGDNRTLAQRVRDACEYQHKDAIPCNMACCECGLYLA